MTTDPVTDFLAAVTAGHGIPADLYAPDAILDATVPMWRFEKHGPAAIAEQLSRWFDVPGELTELSVTDLPTGAVVRFTEECVEDTGPWIVRQAHVLTTSGGRITRQEAWCGGRWQPALQAEMQADLERVRALS